MSQRIIRVNELIKREISLILRNRFRSEAVFYTIFGVDVSNDLRHANVYYSVLGDEEQKKEGVRFFAKNASLIRRQLGQQIVIKYLPFLKFREDNSFEKGHQINQLIDNLDIDSKEPPFSEHNK